MVRAIFGLRDGASVMLMFATSSVAAEGLGVVMHAGSVPTVTFPLDRGTTAEMAASLDGNALDQWRKAIGATPPVASHDPAVAPSSPSRSVVLHVEALQTVSDPAATVFAQLDLD